MLIPFDIKSQLTTFQALEDCAQHCGFKSANQYIRALGKEKQDILKRF